MAQDPGISERRIIIPLYADAEKEVLFLYRYEQLERHLKNREVQGILKSCGYDRFDGIGSGQTEKKISALCRNIQRVSS